MRSTRHGIVRIRASVAVLGVGMLGVASLGAQSSPSCEHWNTAEFFKTATVEDVTACLAAGADPEAGADVAATDSNGETPLHLAAGSNKNPAVLEALLAAGADVLATDNPGWTPLHSASGNQGPALINALLSAGADPTAPASGLFAGLTPLHLAAETNENLAVLKMLIAAGADPMARTEKGRTPLHSAAAFNSAAVVEALIADGAAVEVTDDGRHNAPLSRGRQRGSGSARGAHGEGCQSGHPTGQWSHAVTRSGGEQ